MHFSGHAVAMLMEQNITICKQSGACSLASVVNLTDKLSIQTSNIIMTGSVKTLHVSMQILTNF